MFESEKIIQVKTEENDTLNKELIEKVSEIEEWRDKYFEIENESKNHKNRVENVKKARIHESSLENEIIKLNDALLIKNKEMIDFKDDFNQNIQKERGYHQKNILNF